MSLATCSDVRDNTGRAPQLTALFLLTGSFGVVFIATVAYAGFPRLEIRFTLVVTLLRVFALLALAPVVVLPRLLGH